MTVLSADVQRPVKPPSKGLSTFPVKLIGYTNKGDGNTAHTVYKGSILIIDVSDSDGYGRALDDETVASGDVFAGVAAEQQVVDSDITGDGDASVTAYRDGIWGFAKGSLTIADVGANAYASDDNTITTTSSNNLFVGKIVDVDDTYVWVDIAPAWMREADDAP
jgi:hypothetical protein